MKRSILLNAGVLGILLAMAACKTVSPSTTQVANPAANNSKSTQGSNGEAFKIEKVPFKIGVSSLTVERLAQQNKCETNEGAGLLTPKGPVEIYRLSCTNGQVFMARCELRQCQPMNTQNSQQ